MKWIKVHREDRNVSTHSENILYVPSTFADQFKTKNKLKFGQKEVAITVKVTSLVDNNKGAQFDEAVFLQFSDHLFDELLIKESATYQVYETGTTIHIGPVIGFLLGEQHCYYHHRRLKEITDAMGVYEKVGGLFIAFSHCSISWQENCLYGLYFNNKVKKWQYDKLPLPSVVYRRGFNERNDFVNQVGNRIDWQVFNAVKISKWQLYKHIKAYQSLQPYLPETNLLTADNVLLFLKKYAKVILKPNKLSRGRGITILEVMDNEEVEVQDYRELTTFKISKWQLIDYLQEGKFLEREYILQPFLDLAKINGNPWDMRIVMQKNQWKKWVCNGIECRLAGAGKMLTNICKGGTALHLEEALKQSFGSEIDTAKISKEIELIAMEFCEIMDKTGMHFAEFGLDIALDRQLRYWFIEANVRPAFKGFKKLDREVYKKICYEPILYSASIAGFGWEGNG